MTILEVDLGGELLSISANPGEKLSEALWLSAQIPPSPLCNALGRCGRCRCKFLGSAPEPCEDERAIFSESQLREGWRLACHQLVPPCGLLRVHLPLGTREAHRSPQWEAVPACVAFLGVDLGTTSIQWQLQGASGHKLVEGAFWNPQGGAGADVVSRLQAASSPEGRKRLTTLIRDALGGLIRKLTESGAHIERCCVAANSAMTEIFLGADISGLLASPWKLSVSGGIVEELAGLPVIIPPLPAPFVGGDVSAGLLAVLRDCPPVPFLLIDMGTNAEIALYARDASGEKLWLASAPLGPALEGIGPCCGQPAGVGVITRFSIGPRGLCPHFYGDVIPAACRGISGTGYLSLLAILLNAGLMDRDGHLIDDTVIPLAKKIASHMEQDRLDLPWGQYLTSWDIEILLKVKGALEVALKSVFAAAGIAPGQIQRLFIAGALGNFAQMSDLATLGLIPPVCASRAVLAGNTALAGACILAADTAPLAALTALCQRARVANLTADVGFLAAYLEAMRWGY